MRSAIVMALEEAFTVFCAPHNMLDVNSKTRDKVFLIRKQKNNTSKCGQLRTNYIELQSLPLLNKDVLFQTDS